MVILKIKVQTCSGFPAGRERDKSRSTGGLKNQGNPVMVPGSARFAICLANRQIVSLKSWFRPALYQTREINLARRVASIIILSAQEQ